MLRRFPVPLLHSPRSATETSTHFPKTSQTGSTSQVEDDRVENDSDALDHPVPTHQNASSQTVPPYAFVRILSAAAKSSSITTGEQSHSSILKLGFNTNLFVSTALVDMYCKCRRISQAQQVFDDMPQRNVVTWNSLIHGYSRSHLPIFAVENFVEMMVTGISPSPFTVSSVLVACSRLQDIHMGIMVHCMGFRYGFCSNVVVGAVLVDMYSKCSDIDASRRVFDEMHEKNVVTWTSLITGYTLAERSDDAMLLFREMRRSGVGLNEMTYNSLLSSFSRFEDLGHGKQVHCLVIRNGLESNPYVTVTLLTMYSKCGILDDFVKVCPTVSNQDQISCNSVIAGFSHLGDGGEVLERFSRMRRECIDMDFFTFASVLRAIGILSALEEGRQAHALIFKTGNALNVSVQNGLVSMYAKCGAINNSKQVFSSIDEPDLISWNSLLSGCAQHGYGREAVDLFEQMRKFRVKPDQTTFLSVLSACSHVGFLEKGLEYFYMMKRGDSSTAAGLEHYACVVDLLGRAGHLNEAESFISRMPIQPGVSVYRALLSACQVHGNVEIALRTANCLLELCPNDSSTYVLLSNAFAALGCWDDAAGVRKFMSEKGVRKRPAWSWIEDRTAV